MSPGDGTLAIPGRLWSKIPESVKAFDAHCRELVMSRMNEHDWFWRNLSWVSRERAGMSCFFAVVIAIGLLLYFKHSTTRDWPRRFASYSLRVAVFALLWGLGDAFASLIKQVFGRLKPFVKVYVPHVAQPLSFPSGHAFTLALGAMLLLSALRDAPVRLRRVLVALAGSLALVRST
jgi:hypothetical protein